MSREIVNHVCNINIFTVFHWPEITSRMSTYKVSSSEMELHNNEKDDSVPAEPEYRWSQNAKQYLREYCTEGSLHGIKYLGQRRTSIEK